MLRWRTVGEHAAETLFDQIFDFMVRDMAKFALQLYSQPSSTAKQMACRQRMIKKAVHDPARYDRVWSEQVAPFFGRSERGLRRRAQPTGASPAAALINW
jgi:hypothetical protein